MAKTMPAGWTGGRAFARPAVQASAVVGGQEGMTVRECFAVQILMALIAKDESGVSSEKDWRMHAAEAYRAADALLEEFYKRSTP